MSDHHNFITEISTIISIKYPLIGIGLSYLVMVLGVVLPDLHNVIWDWEIPKIVMQGTQLLLGTGGFLIGYFTFRRNFKNKNKKNK